MENLELKNIDKLTCEKVIEYLKSIDYNDAYIAHFLENADKEQDAIAYIKKKFPELNLD